MAWKAILNPFRRYGVRAHDQERMIRDLIQLVEDLNKALKDLNDRLETIENP